jgi:hypothetical protein
MVENPFCLEVRIETSNKQMSPDPGTIRSDSSERNVKPVVMDE